VYDPWGLGDPQKTCIFRGFWAAMNHHSVAASFLLWFLLSSVCLSIFFSLPILSHLRCRHGVALVRISDPGLKRAARSSLKIQDAKIAKNSPSAHHRTTLSGSIFATKAHIDYLKKTC